MIYDENGEPRAIKRGDVYMADLPDKEIGSTQAGKRPVIITSSNRINYASPTVIVAILTSKLKRPWDECHVVLPKLEGLPKQSMVAVEQRKTISKEQLVSYCCTLDEREMNRVTRALKKSEKPDIKRRRRRGKKTRVRSK